MRDRVCDTADHRQTGQHVAYPVAREARSYRAEGVSCVVVGSVAREARSYGAGLNFLSFLGTDAFFSTTYSGRPSAPYGGGTSPWISGAR